MCKSRSNRYELNQIRKKKSFRSICYFQAKIEIGDCKFETFVYVINDNFVDFDIIIVTNVMHQGTLDISDNDVKINMKMILKNSLINSSLLKFNWNDCKF